jgi:hypothetical protein
MEKSKSFHRLPVLVFLIVDGPVVFVAACVVSETLRTKVATRIPALTPRAARVLLGVTLLAHVTESAVAGRIAGKKGLSRAKWSLQTLIAGFPSIWALSREKATSKS